MKIVGLEIFKLDRGAAQEFLEVYKGVLNEYPSLVKELSQGPCLVLAI